MPTYVWLGRWTDQGIRNVKDTLTLTEQANAAIEKAGGRTVGVWWTHGAYDIVTVTEFPDDEAGSVATNAGAWELADSDSVDIGMPRRVGE